MKAISLCLLCSAVLFQLLGLALWNPSRSARDYQEIMGYVARVEKEGFHAADFDKFALERKVMQKEVFIQPVLARTCHVASLLLVLLSLGVVLWRKKKEPNQAPEPTAPSGRGSS